MTEPQSKPHDEDPALAPSPAEATPAEVTAEDPSTTIASLKDQVLRALADAENTRRRAQKEREETSKYAVTNFARDMLTVADNFRRALDATPKDTNDVALKNLITGIEATERQLAATLDRFGVKKVDPLGQMFDPNFHRVMMEVDSPDAPAGTIVQVLQSGYVIHDRLLREALVAVSKGSSQTTQHIDTSA